MKDFLFVSDFDGTITRKDFYEIVIENHLPIKGKKYHEMFIEGKMQVFDMLQRIFTSANASEQELLEDILSIKFDDYFINFVEEVKDSGGDIIVLSAGSKYYIEKLFAHKGIKDIKIYSNPGIYKDRGLHLVPDENDEFFSKELGIDKFKVVKSLSKDYKKVYYAGDGSPDFEAAKQADLIFARSSLAKLCNKDNIDFIPYDSFKDISNYLSEIGVLFNESI